MRQEAEYDVNDFTNPQSSKGVHAHFYHHPVRDEVESAKAGRPVFKDVEFIEIRAPGNQNNIVKRRVRPMDLQRFPQQYKSFKEGNPDQLVGTPLTEVTWLNRSQIEELHYMRIRTLEQLAEISDSVCANSAGLFGIKQKAKDWLEKSAAAAPITALQQENDELRRRLEALEQANKPARNRKDVPEIE